MSQPSLSKLMSAESEAKRQVDDAKKQRDQLLRMADEEAREQIEHTRQAKEVEFNEIQSKSGLSDESTRAALESATERQKSKLATEASKNKESVITFLTDLVQSVNTDFTRYVKAV